MKRLPVFTFTACLFLGLITTTHTVIAAIAPPPPPIVIEAPAGELDLHLLAGADATVEVTYPEIANEHTVGLYWTGNNQQYRAPVQTISGGARKVIFKIPNATVAQDLDFSPVLTASVGVGGDKLVISEKQTIKVVSNVAPGQFPPPTLPDVPNNDVDVGALTGNLNVRVHYPSLGAGQAVQLLWKGATSYTSGLRIPQNNTPLDFTIPNADVIASLGKKATLTYEVTLDGQPPKSSELALLNINLASLPDKPTVPSAPLGQLDLKELRSRDLSITYTYPGITVGHTVGIRWAGDPVFNTPYPIVGPTPRPLQFTIPYAKVSQEKDKTVIVTASVGTGNNTVTISPGLALSIIDSRPSGPQVADGLNARYNDTRTTCDNNQPSYYCNGVTTRGTDNGNFDPWDPSPTQVRKGSVSVSHIRKDSKVTNLWKSSGYILLSQNEANHQGKGQEYLCAFPHDGATDISRVNYGCGFQATRGTASELANRLMQITIRNPELLNLFRENEQVVDRLANGQDASDLLQKDPIFAALLRKEPELGKLLQENLAEVEASNRSAPKIADQSTCADKGAQTLAGWSAFTQTLTHRVQQCSLSTQDPAQFAVNLKARESSVPAPVYSTWNELLIKVWAGGIPAQLPLEAFYYLNATGLPEAKAYQHKYFARTDGLWLPIIKLDMTKLAGNPFSYTSTDQALQP